MNGLDSRKTLRIGPARIAIGCLTLGLAALLGWVVYEIPERPLQLATELQDIAVKEQLIETSGIGNPVTAVLLNFRAYDTLLELAVLELAVLAVQAMSAGTVRRRGGSDWRHNRLLTATLAIVVPVSIVVAGDLLWMGADHPGGAFQAGTVLSGAGIMLILADRLNRRFFSDWRYRLAVVAGVAVFVVVGLGVMAVGEQFLQYPAGLAKTLILAIETAAMASVAVVFIILFDAVAGPVGLWNQSDSPDLREVRQ